MTQQVSTTHQVEEQNEQRCRHYWVIQPADGPISQGACRNCGETREFKNYVEASTWGDDKGSSRATAAVAQTVASHVEDGEEE